MWGARCTEHRTHSTRVHRSRYTPTMWVGCVYLCVTHVVRYPVLHTHSRAIRHYCSTNLFFIKHQGVKNAQKWCSVYYYRVLCLPVRHVHVLPLYRPLMHRSTICTINRTHTLSLYILHSTAHIKSGHTVCSY